MAHLSETAAAKINEICDRYAAENTPLIMILSDIQREFGYVPLDVQEVISARTGIPVAEIYGVVTFYSFFSLQPKGKYVIGCCLGTACYVKGAQKIIDQFCEILGIQPGQTTEDGMFTIDALRCIGACAFDAIENLNGSANEELCCKIAEYSAAVCAGRPCFHISLVRDISPNCDCHGENDAPILPDVGMFASFDPIALDQACADACLKCDPLPNSQLSDNMHSHDFVDHHDHFVNCRPEAEWKSCLAHGEKIGLGSRDYELITVK